ncbi:MAG: hypothetical protein ACP5MB_11675, partial [bacterium]
MFIFVGQPLSVNVTSKVEQKVIMSKPVQVIKGKNFTYYVRTKNGVVSSVVAKSQRELAPASYFIQDANQCTKKLVMRMPLRLAQWQYSCPSGVYNYTTFGIPGNLNTIVKM